MTPNQLIRVPKDKPIYDVQATSKEEAAGLAAHQHIILQLHNDLGYNRWLKYDTEYREWAAAKGICVQCMEGA